MEKPMKKGTQKSKESYVFKPRIYTKREIAGFLLNDAIDEKGYQEVRKEVEAMGFDPDSIPHHRPSIEDQALWEWVRSTPRKEKPPGISKSGRGTKSASVSPRSKSYKKGLLSGLGDLEEIAACLNTALTDAAKKKNRGFSFSLFRVWSKPAGKKLLR
jgi:hypothetical protein